MLWFLGMATIQFEQFMSISFVGPDGKKQAANVGASEFETIGGTKFVSLAKRNRSLKKMLGATPASYLDTLRCLRTAKTIEVLTKLQLSGEDAAPSGAEALFGKARKVEKPLEEHAKKKRLIRGGAVPHTVTITMPGYTDKDTQESEPPMEAKVKSSMDHREVVAIQADPAIWLHLMGASRAHDAAAAASSQSPEKKNKLVSWRADRHVVVARHPGKKGSSKIFSVPRDASQEHRDAIFKKAEQWLATASNEEDNEEDGEDKEDDVEEKEEEGEDKEEEGEEKGEEQDEDEDEEEVDE